jgi:hypothetical protein
VLQFFDVYSEAMTTVYSETYWAMQDHIPLPADIVARFANKTMAMVGYESDQVYKTDQGEVPVPIFRSYNHHYCAYLKNDLQVELVKVRTPEGDMQARAMSHGSPYHYAIKPRPGARLLRDHAGVVLPNSQFISEGNGGEYRKSYHGMCLYLFFVGVMFLYVFNVYTCSARYSYRLPCRVCTNDQLAHTLCHPTNADRYLEPRLQWHRL